MSNSDQEYTETRIQITEVLESIDLPNGKPSDNAELLCEIEYSNGSKEIKELLDSYYESDGIMHHDYYYSLSNNGLYSLVVDDINETNTWRVFIDYGGMEDNPPLPAGIISVTLIIREPVFDTDSSNWNIINAQNGYWEGWEFVNNNYCISTDYIDIRDGSNVYIDIETKNGKSKSDYYISYAYLFVTEGDIEGQVYIINTADNGEFLVYDPDVWVDCGYSFSYLVVEITPSASGTISPDEIIVKYRKENANKNTSTILTGLEHVIFTEEPPCSAADITAFWKPYDTEAILLPAFRGSDETKTYTSQIPNMYYDVIIEWDGYSWHIFIDDWDGAGFPGESIIVNIASSSKTTETPSSTNLMLGNLAISNLYLGDLPVAKVYLGDMLIYDTTVVEEPDPEPDVNDVLIAEYIIDGTTAIAPIVQEEIEVSPATEKTVRVLQDTYIEVEAESFDDFIAIKYDSGTEVADSSYSIFDYDNDIYRLTANGMVFVIIQRVSGNSWTIYGYSVDIGGYVSLEEDKGISLTATGDDMGIYVTVRKDAVFSFANINATTKSINNGDGTSTVQIYTSEENAHPNKISFNGMTNLLSVEYITSDSITNADYMFAGCTNLTYVKFKHDTAAQTQTINTTLQASKTNLIIETPATIEDITILCDCSVKAIWNNDPVWSYQFDNGTYLHVTNNGNGTWSFEGDDRGSGQDFNITIIVPNSTTATDIIDLSKVESMDYMFYNCSSLTNESFATKIENKVERVEELYASERSSDSINVGSIDNIIRLEQYGTELNFRSWSYSSGVYSIRDTMQTIKVYDNGLVEIIASDEPEAYARLTVYYYENSGTINLDFNFDLSNVRSASHVFDGCTKLQ